MNEIDVAPFENHQWWWHTYIFKEFKDFGGSIYPTELFNELGDKGTNTVCRLCVGPSPYGDHGVYIKEPIEPTVMNNSITNFSTGVHLFGEFFNGATSYSSYISNNTIEVSGTGSMLTGILAEAPAPTNLNGNPLFLYIEDNYISSAGSACIELNNASVNDILSTDLLVSTNTVYVLPSLTANDRTQRSGILLINSQSFNVYNNTIKTTGTYLNSTLCYADTSVVGIRSVLSQGYHGCNNIYDLGQCMKFEGMCYPSLATSNDMELCFDGFVLESDGWIGPQGSTGNPSGNEWVSFFDRSQTYTFKSDATNSPLYVLSSPASQDPTNNLGTITSTPYGSGTIISTTGTVPSCPATCTYCQVIATSAQYRPLAQKTVDDSITYALYNSEMEYLGQQTIFSQLVQDTSLMTGSNILHSFYHTTSTGVGATNNIGAFYTVSSDISQGNFSSAQTLNNSITPVNNIEKNQQLVNYVYINTLGAGVDTVTTSEYDTLVNIATQCPFEGGTPVFQARALLNRLLNVNFVFTDSCNTDTSTHSPHRLPGNNTISNSIVDTIQAKVYPNPANNMLNIEINLKQSEVAYFEMYDNIGKEIENIELFSDLTTLPLVNFPAGIYYYRITDKNKKMIKADKQLIIH